MPYGLELAQASGAQAAGNFINEGMGMLFAGPKRRAQLRTARGLQEIEQAGWLERLKWNEQMALRMFENTGYEAQVEQMLKAGLNPALLYGMSAGGGTTQAQAPTSGGSGGSEPPIPSRGSEGMGLMIGQMGLLEAQKENIEADTANKKAQTANTGTQTDLNKLELQFKKDSYEDNLDIIRGTFSNLQEDANRKNRENKIGDKTIDEQILKAAIENELIQAQTGLTNQQIEQSKAQVQKMAAEIAQTWLNLNRQERELKLKAWEAEMRINMPGISQAIGTIINNAMGVVDKIIGNKLEPRNPAPKTNK